MPTPGLRVYILLSEQSPTQSGFDLRTLASHLASSDLWAAPDAALIVREAPPVLGVLGSFDEPERQRIASLAWQLNHMLPTLERVSYELAERLTGELGEVLRELLGSRLEEAEFTAIPRGGLLVLGLLAYHLDLGPKHFASSEDRDRPLVVVDDCALSGRRLREFLDECDRPRIVFAHLHSHPALREAVGRHSRVQGIIAARDLIDLAPERLGTEYAAWARAWAEREGGSCFWAGQTTAVSYPWSEPETAVWDPAKQEAVRGWSLVPGDRCLKNRLSQRTDPIPVLSPAPMPATHQLHDRYLVAEKGPNLLCIDLERSQVHLLEGVAAEVWRLGMQTPTTEALLVELRERYPDAPSSMETEIAGFVENLRSRDLFPELR